MVRFFSSLLKPLNPLSTSSTSLPVFRSNFNMKRWLDKLSRKRPIGDHGSVDSIPESGQLDRCLTTLDLISIGVGSCCGTGMYLTAGIIAHREAGPGGIISIILAGLASILTGFHYAELTGLAPYISGSAYMYTYFTVGEFSAFCIGWGQTLEYIIGTSANAVALSVTIRSLDSWGITNYVDDLSTYIYLPPIDWIAVIICLVLTWILCSGAKMSTRVNNILNLLNLVVLIIFLGGAIFLGTFSNIEDHGGFFPMGTEGLVVAMPTAYFALIGFDGLCTTGGECLTPVKSIPRSIILSLVINIVIYSSIVIGLTCLLPYNRVPENTGMVDVFEILGYPALKAFMMAGAIAGLFAATFGSLFPLPRMLQTIAEDGLIFRYLSRISPSTQTAVRATTISGVIAAFLAGVVDIELLIELVLVGTMLGYIIATYATLVSRYVTLDNDISAALSNGSPSSANLISHAAAGLKKKSSDANMLKDYCTMEDEKDNGDSESSYNYTMRSREGSITIHRSDSIDKQIKKHTVVGADTPIGAQADPATITTSPSLTDTACLSSDSTPLLSSASDEDDVPSGPQLRSVLDLHRVLVKPKTWLEEHLTLILLSTYFSMFVMCFMMTHFMDRMANQEIPALIIFAIALIATFGLSLCMVCMPTKPRPSNKSEVFRAPLVPFITIITAGINIYLMTSLRLVTWIIFFGWMALGLSIYFIYGLRHSTLEVKKLTGNLSNVSLDNQSASASQTDIAKSCNVGIDNEGLED